MPFRHIKPNYETVLSNFWSAFGAAKLTSTAARIQAEHGTGANALMPIQPETNQPPASPFDGTGDHDEPYRFGRRPNARAAYPFTERQFARLLILRGHLRENLNCSACDGERAG